MQNLSSQTECINTSAYKEWELEAYADGEEMAHVVAHLAQCPACAEKLQLLTTFSAQISGKLYRFDCPPADDLRAYYWRDLAAAETNKIQAHLALCLHCTGEMDRISTLVETDTAMAQQPTLKESADAVAKKLRQQVLDLVEQVDIAVATLVTPLAPQMAGIALRGEQKKPSMLLFEANDTDISLTLQQESDKNWKIAGQVLTTSALVAGEFRLVPEDGNAAEKTIADSVDETGNFIANDVPSGIYQLIFRLNGNAIVIPTLTIGA